MVKYMANCIIAPKKWNHRIMTALLHLNIKSKYERNTNLWQQIYDMS